MECLGYYNSKITDELINYALEFSNASLVATHSGNRIIISKKEKENFKKHLQNYKSAVKNR